MAITSLKDKLGLKQQESKLSDQIYQLTESIGSRNQFIDERIKTAELEAKKLEQQWRLKCKNLGDEYLGVISGLKKEV